MHYNNLCVVASAIVVAALSQVVDLAPTAKHYFGEPIPLAAGDQNAFDRGFALFVKDWSRERDGLGNAPSCVACHSVPMPGGSGMSDMALVSVATAAAPGSREEIVQRPTNEVPHGPVRRTPALFGIGFLEKAQSDSRIGSFSLGTHGVQSDLRNFVSSAFATELGVSTPTHCARRAMERAYPSSCRSRIANSEIDAVVAYLRFLAPPAPPSRPTPDGKRLFAQVGCATCHIPEVISTGLPASREPVRIQPFTDLKRHDIGTSTRGAVRTAPLWGLNSYGPPYLSDASGISIEAAVLAHRGEAAASRDAFDRLSSADRAVLLDYLRSF